MSPNTTPIEPSAMAQRCRSRVVCPSSVPWAAAACAMEAAFLDCLGSDAAQHELAAAYTPAPDLVKARREARATLVFRRQQQIPVSVSGLPEDASHPRTPEHAVRG